MMSYSIEEMLPWLSTADREKYLKEKAESAELLRKAFEEIPILTPEIRKKSMNPNDLKG
jgi:hypothetical protein